ncbi:MAG: tryptophanase [bacterium]|nr:tryptophanase [bacterium]
MLKPPFKIKVIEYTPGAALTRAKRARAIARAGYNTFLLKSDEVYIDFLTDSGTSAQSDAQKAGLELGDEAYAGSRSFYHMEKTVRELFGYRYVVPTHQGRGAEHLMSRICIQPGQIIPNNLYFTTRRFHQELARGVWVDVAVSEAHDPKNTFPFKGNVDIKKLLRVIKRHGVKNIAYISMEAAVNMAGGQPFSLDNLKKVRRISKQYRIPLYLDITRIFENAYFIQQREKGYSKKTVREIAREITLFSDGCTMSAKKDGVVNIGGFLAMNDRDFFRRAKEEVVVFEGLHTYGGMAGRDMEALAIGLKEFSRDEEVAYYVSQVAYLGKELRKRGIPIVLPVGGHAVFLDAKRFLSHIPQEQFPAERLTAEIYLESGVRTMERGIVSGQHGKEPYDGLELVRLAIPRRAYHREHLDIVVDGIEKVFRRRKYIKGLKMVYEPKSLRFFQARFAPVGRMK